MSWRVVAALLIAIFAILAFSTLATEPLYDIGDTFQDIADSDADVDSSEVADQRTSGIRAFENLVLILVGGLLAWGAWRVLRKELTEGRL